MYVTFSKTYLYLCYERPSDHPKGSCLHKGSAHVRDALKAELKKKDCNAHVRTNNAGCLDACEHGVAMVIYPEGVRYGGITPNDVFEIVEQHVEQGKIVTRLEIKNRIIVQPREYNL